MKQNQNSSINTIAKNSVASRVQIIIGYSIAVFCGLIAIVGSVNTGFESSFDVTMVIVFTVFTVCGIWQIVRGKKRKKLIALFKEYAARLAADPLRSINKLAAATGTEAEAVKKNILAMIRKGYFVNAYVDFDRSCLIFAPESNPAQQEESAAEYIRVCCPGCGAKNKVPKGTVGECEFCGSYLAQG